MSHLMCHTRDMTNTEYATILDMTPARREAHDLRQEKFQDAQWELMDRISEYLDTKPGQYLSCSQIARGKGVKADTREVQAVIEWMAEAVYVNATGNGAWRRYGSRR